MERQRHSRDIAHPTYETIDKALAAPPVYSNSKNNNDHAFN